ncbi:MAG: arginine-tRNA-protein transferase [Bacteroidota bacterium]|nr:arginine-tRNA-protein transferase [Candidatus Kapabacteria bacterium]MDW8221064.1 arginine-tRNA-protein transferase [Bacteroidota bacterium]
MKPNSQHSSLAHKALHHDPSTIGGMGIREWFEERWRDESIDGQLYDAFYCSRATPQMMDACWLDGWRHFGTYFFRTQVDMFHGMPVTVMPLRIRLADFTLSHSQRRVLRKNSDVHVHFQPIQLTNEHRTLFEQHKQRFTENQPESLQDFLSPEPAITPCLAYECRVLDASRTSLLAVSFLDIGDESLSSVYAMFDPRHARRSLGIYTLLCEIAYAQHLGKKYLYLGYAYDVPSFYDYKKHFAAVEYYNWRGEWLPLSRYLL